MIRLKPVDKHNWYDCTQLEVSERQKEIFPVPVVYWLAESAYCGFHPLAVYSDDELVGFTVYAQDPDDGSYWIMAMLIDRHHQRKGYGRLAMQELMRHIMDTYDCDKLILGHRPNNMHAASLYESLGFAVIDQTEDEIIRCYRKPNSPGK